MAQHLDSYRLPALCEALQASRSGFYRWKSRKHEVSAVDKAVKTAFTEHKGRAGAPCLTADIRAMGVDVSERTVGRSLRKLGLRCRYKRKFRPTTDSKHGLPIAPNLLERQFTVSKPNVAWVGDITYLQTQDGWLYLATMIDLFNRQVIGWQISSRIDQALVNDALMVTLSTRGKPSGVIVHTDRGSQYCSKSFAAIVKKYGALQSMRPKGNCWDNAVAKSFFATFKKQTIFGKPIVTRNQMRQQVFEFIEIYYNRVRRHLANGWVTPVEFERLCYKNLETKPVHYFD
jgi:transposase InsO family protein